MIQFLFRKSKSSRAFIPNTDHPREEKSSKQWTNKLASLVEDIPATEKLEGEQQLQGSESLTRHIPPTHHTSLRLEGPYFTPANPHLYSTVICLVAGTGISGAIAIAAAFNAQSSTPKLPQEQAIPISIPAAPKPTEAGADASAKIPTAAAVIRPSSPTTSTVAIQNGPSPIRTWKRCIIVWSVREADYIKLPFFKKAENPGLELRTHLTGPSHERLNMEKVISDTCATDGNKDGGGRKVWVYLSGPNAFISTGEKACKKLGVDYYGARWS